MYLILNYSVGRWDWQLADNARHHAMARRRYRYDPGRLGPRVEKHQHLSILPPPGQTPAADRWDTSSNWSAVSPQLNTQTATFGSVAASNVTVDWTNSRTVGGLIFNSSVNYTLGSGSGNNSLMLTSVHSHHQRSAK